MADDLRSGMHVEGETDEERFGRLCDEAYRSLHFGDVDRAEAIAGELLQERSDSTTVMELMGDVALIRDRVSEAREYYRQAVELEPANADAERKFGMSLLAPSAEERREMLLQRVSNFDAEEAGKTRRPTNAVLNAMVFPGIGQLYNREHEKGLAMLAAGAVLLMTAFYFYILVPYSAVIAAHGSRRGMPVSEQMANLRDAVSALSTGQWLIALLSVIGYFLLYSWGIYDAWRQASAKFDRFAEMP